MFSKYIFSKYLNSSATLFGKELLPVRKILLKIEKTTIIIRMLLVVINLFLLNMMPVHIFLTFFYIQKLYYV